MLACKLVTLMPIKIRKSPKGTPIGVTLDNVPKRCRHREALMDTLGAREPQAPYEVHIQEKGGGEG